MKEVYKQYWLAEVEHMDNNGTVWSVTLIDGSHSNTSGVAKALKLHNSISVLKSDKKRVMVTIEVVPDIPVKINEDAVNTLNSISQINKK